MKAISAALVKAQKGFAPALKTSTNPHFKSRYVDLAGCVEAVIDALNDNGIFLMQTSHECSDGVIVETQFIHESGESISAGKLHVPAQKQDPQGYGSALTYARRYALMAACGIAPEDDDGEAAVRGRLAPTVNFLDAVKPGAVVQVESPKTVQALASGAPTYTLAIPGKEPRLYDTSEGYMKGTLELRDKVEKSAMASRTKMTKLRELREANDPQLDKIDVQHKAALVADYNLRLKRLGASLEGDTDGQQ